MAIEDDERQKYRKWFDSQPPEVQKRIEDSCRDYMDRRDDLEIRKAIAIHWLIIEGYDVRQRMREAEDAAMQFKDELTRQGYTSLDAFDRSEDHYIENLNRRAPHTGPLQ
jgi:hypothetical protein